MELWGVAKRGMRLVILRGETFARFEMAGLFN